MRPCAMPERRVKIVGACMSPWAIAPGAGAGEGSACGAGLEGGEACAMVAGAEWECCCAQACPRQVASHAAKSTTLSIHMPVRPFSIICRERDNTSIHRDQPGPAN